MWNLSVRVRIQEICFQFDLRASAIHGYHPFHQASTPKAAGRSKFFLLPIWGILHSTPWSPWPWGLSLRTSGKLLKFRYEKKPLGWCQSSGWESALLPEVPNFNLQQLLWGGQDPYLKPWRAADSQCLIIVNRGTRDWLSRKWLPTFWASSKYHSLHTTIQPQLTSTNLFDSMDAFPGSSGLRHIAFPKLISRTPC